MLTCAGRLAPLREGRLDRGPAAFAASYREEARKLRALPEATPAPRLLWADDGDWVVLGPGVRRGPGAEAPVATAELDACLDALETVGRRCSRPLRTALHLDPFADEFAAWPAFWDHVNATRDLPHGDGRRRARRGVRRGRSAGDTLVHTDVRDDNVLLTDDGRALFCDWNWPTVGAAWLDSLFMLIGPRGDGLDVESRHRRAARSSATYRPSTSTACWPLICGYFLKSADDPVPPTSPYLRDVQRWQGEVVWDWLVRSARGLGRLGRGARTWLA